MYGLVNKAIRGLMLAKASPPVWQQVCAKANVTDDSLIISESYDDRVTYTLAEESSRALGLPLDDFLRTLGQWWIHETAMRDFQHLMAASGTTLRQFVLGLPHLHTRISLIFPKLQPPEFECTEDLPDRLKLHYRSHRSGLAPFVIGMLEGLSRHFNTPIRITHEAQKGTKDQHDIFLIEWTDPHP
jgi:hypothetical protein